MLLLLSIPTREDVPLFFGPKLQAMIRAYARGHAFEAHIISELPRYNGKEVVPATHNILLSFHKPHWLNYTIGPFNLSQLSEPKTYKDYFVNFKGPIDDW